MSGLPAGGWRASFFRSERVRSLLNNVEKQGAWPLADELCDDLGRALLDEQPGWAQARCRFVVAPAPTWRSDAPTGAPRVEYRRMVNR